jgi:hypothetical protein
LHPSGWAEDGVPGLDLTRGCPLRRARFPARPPADAAPDEVVLYADTAERLAAELSGPGRRPRAVFVGPSADPFPPLGAVQDEAARVIRVLAEHGVEAWLLTRGLIQAAALEALAAARGRVKVTVALTTCDRALQRALEPGAAPPRLRLRQIARLRRLGIPVQAALDPLVPGVTDTRVNLTAVLGELAAGGVGHVTAGYLYLRGDGDDPLAGAHDPLGLADAVRPQYAAGPVLRVPGPGASRHLPRSRRQRGYAAVMALAAVHGITVGVSRLTNPDFTAPAARPEPGGARRLLPLFLAAGQAKPPGRDEPLEAGRRPGT